MKRVPSDLFVEAILQGYQAEKAVNGGKPVTPSAIWDHICMRAIGQQGMFGRLFEWDARKASQNRIGTIIEVIEAGQVPGLSMSQNARGGKIVVEVSA